MTVRVLADRHHGVLWEALAMLFVDRAILGECELYAYADGYHVARREDADVWPIVSDFPPRQVLAVSDAFVAEHAWDVMIGTAPATRGTMRALAARTGALYVDQVANEWDKPAGGLLLRSMSLPGNPGLVYHPEFHRVPPGTVARSDVIAAFHVSLLTNGCEQAWFSLAQLMPEYEFRLYGAEPWEFEPWRIAPEMGAATFVYHDKTTDGYGFAVHEAFASGRPVIGHARHYQDKLAAELWVDGVTCLDLRGNTEVDAGRIRDTDADAMGRAAQARFAELVDFDAESAQIKGVLEAALSGRLVAA